MRERGGERERQGEKKILVSRVEREREFSFAERERKIG